MIVRSLACAVLAGALCGRVVAQEKGEAKKPKLRILYLEGAPRWEYRFLKNVLIGDPSVAVQVYLTTASEDFEQDSSPGLTHLTRVPEGGVGFADYDVVILGDLPEEWIREKGAGLGQQLTDFVKVRGGGLVVLAGSEFRAGPEIGDLLPVALPETLLPGPGKGFRLELTGKGAEFLRLDEDSEKSRRLWEEELPPVYSSLEGVVPKAGAEVLAVRSGEGFRESLPVIVEWRMGRGRVLFLGTDQFWRWRAGRDDLAYHRFWKRAVSQVARVRRF
jgi:hypothetical protein